MLSSRGSDIFTVQREHYKDICHSQEQPFATTRPTNSIEVTDDDSSSVSLPPELLLEVFSYLEGCQSTFYATSLVCRQWLYCATLFLYCHPKVCDTYGWATFMLTLTRKKKGTSYGDLIKSIDLSSKMSIVEKKDNIYKQRKFARLSLDNSRHSSFHRNNNTNYADSSRHNSAENQSFGTIGQGPYIVLSTSSLLQISYTCKNITDLNLSFTSLFTDSIIVETGEYVSGLLNSSIPFGLTHNKIRRDDTIKSIGKECSQLQQLKIQFCGWVTDRVIYMFAHHCPSLQKLDARGSTKCTVRRLITNTLESTVGDDSTAPPLIDLGENPDNYQFQILIAEDNYEEMVSIPYDFEQRTYEHVRLPYTDRATRQEVPVDIKDLWTAPANTSLKDIVYGIIVDAKRLGTKNLDWIQDY